MYGNYLQEQQEEEEVWTIQEEGPEKCDYHLHETDEEVRVNIQMPVIQKVLAMCMLHRDTEFLVYLLGHHNQDGRPVAEDVYIPNQIVSRGSVETPGDENIPENVIGVLHKHPGNGKQRFSITDDHHLNVNHDLSIVIPENGVLWDWMGQVRHNPPCGCTDVWQEAKLRFIILTEDVNEAQDRILQKVHRHQQMTEADWQEWEENKDVT